MELISAELLLKFRNYENYIFTVDRIAYLESAKQKIVGITFYKGRNLALNNSFYLRFHWGIGIRYLISSVTRPGFYLDGHQWPEENFRYNLILPSIHLGIAVLLKVGRNKA